MSLLFANVAFFFVLATGTHLSTRRFRPRAKLTLAILSSPLAVPALLYSAYYLHRFDDWAWFYEFRSHSVANLAPAFLGLPIGLAFGLWPTDRWKAYTALGAALLVILPFLKIALGSPDLPTLQDRWSGLVCLQTSPATCGPASAATLLAHRFQDRVTERMVAEASRSTRSGTEIWYLAQFLRHRGYQVRFVTRSSQIIEDSIAGVRVHGAGHFVAVLREADQGLVIADPLVGTTPGWKQALPQFTGFYMQVYRTAG